MIRHLALFAVLPLALATGGQIAGLAEAAAETDAASDTAPNAFAAISGKDSYRKCVACHKIEKGAPNGVGPNLHGIVGKKVASVKGYTYSTALKAKGGTWNAAALDAYLKNPRTAVPGTKMIFAGIANAAERKALIAYMAAQK
jgi:cytochrome c